MIERIIRNDKLQTRLRRLGSNTAYLSMCVYVYVESSVHYY